MRFHSSRLCSIRSFSWRRSCLISRSWSTRRFRARRQYTDTTTAIASAISNPPAISRNVISSIISCFLIYLSAMSFHQPRQQSDCLPPTHKQKPPGLSGGVSAEKFLLRQLLFLTKCFWLSVFPENPATSALTTAEKRCHAGHHNEYRLIQYKLHQQKMHNPQTYYHQDQQ